MINTVTLVHVLMPQEEAVTSWIACVTKWYCTLLAVPGGVCALPVLKTPDTPFSVPARRVFKWRRRFHREVAKWKRTKMWPLSTSLPTTTVVPDEFLRQLDSEVEDCPVFRVGSVALVQHKCVGDSNVQQKVKNVFVKLSTFSSTAVVAS